MNAQWKQVCTKLIVKTTCWLLTEAVLNMAGLDDIANYGEFVFGREAAIACSSGTAIVLVAS